MDEDHGWWMMRTTRIMDEDGLMMDEDDGPHKWTMRHDDDVMMGDGDLRSVTLLG